MADDEATINAINTLRQQVRAAETRLAKTEGALEAAKAAFAANKKKLQALGYKPNEDVAAAIKCGLEKIRAVLAQVEELLDDAEAVLGGTES